MIGGRRPISGRKPGDKRVRVERHHSPYFRYTGPGQLTAKAAASAPTTPMGRFVWRIKGVLIGRPLANEEEIGERLSKKKALAIFSSDAISSSAYATEEILLAFLLAGVGGAAFLYSLQVSIAIAILLGIVAFSYRQVCIAYPNGGGSYSVSKANFGKHGVARRGLGAAHRLHAHRRGLDVVRRRADRVGRSRPSTVVGGSSASSAIGLIMLGNLRGLREAGNIFAIPTYLFLVSAFLMIGVGVFRILFQGDTGPPPTAEVIEATADTARASGFLILLRAFASGAVALTGTEAIATGVPAFKPPEAKNAAPHADGDGRDPGASCSSGSRSSPRPSTSSRSRSPSRRSSPRSRTTSTATRVGFYLFQAFTALLLFLAANTSLNAFPRLGAVLAEDGFIPRQFAFRGDRLAYSHGDHPAGRDRGARRHRRRRLDPRADPAVRGGRVHRLHDRPDAAWSATGSGPKDTGWRRRLSINAIGAVLTGVIAIVVTSVKFLDGACS